MSLRSVLVFLLLSCESLCLQQSSLTSTLPSAHAQTGNSVLLHVKGFLPYFWVAAPKGFTNSDCLPLLEHLNVRSLFPSFLLSFRLTSPPPPPSSPPLQTAHFNGARPIKAVSIANKRSLWGYKGDAVSPFIKLTVVDTKQYPKVRNAFERGEVNYKEYFDGSALMTFESNIAYTLRFMIDHHVHLSLPSLRTRRKELTFPSSSFPFFPSSLQIVGMNWLELKAGTWTHKTSKLSNCQYEVECEYVRLPFPLFLFQYSFFSLIELTPFPLTAIPP